MMCEEINIIQYTPKNLKETNDFLVEYLRNVFNIEEENITKIIIEYKTNFEKRDICLLKSVNDALYESKFITQFLFSLRNNIPCIYSRSWDHQMGYWATGHDIRFSYALYNNDKISIRDQLGHHTFEKLQNIIDINGIKLKDSNYRHRNYRD